MPVQIAREDNGDNRQKVVVRMRPWVFPLVLSLITGVGGFTVGNVRQNDRQDWAIKMVEGRLDALESKHSVFEAEQRELHSQEMQKQFVTRAEWLESTKRIDDNLDFVAQQLGVRSRHGQRQP